MQALEGRAGEVGAESGVQHRAQVVDGERLQAHPGDTLLWKRPGQSERKGCSRFAPREQKPDRLVLQTADREPQRGRRGGIEPLHVIERDQHGTRSSCLPEGGQ